MEFPIFRYCHQPQMSLCVSRRSQKNQPKRNTLWRSLCGSMCPAEKENWWGWLFNILLVSVQVVGKWWCGSCKRLLHSVQQRKPSLDLSSRLPSFKLQSPEKRLFSLVASKAVDALLDSKWGNKAKTEPLFCSRQGCADYCSRLDSFAHVLYTVKDITQMLCTACK